MPSGRRGSRPRGWCGSRRRPTPCSRIVDIAALAEVTHARGALVLVDNTFATPYLQQPLALGADMVIHSTTKYLGGHSDVVGGFVGHQPTPRSWPSELAYLQNAVGAVPGPFDCFLVLRGVKTLAVRMERHCHERAAGGRGAGCPSGRGPRSSSPACPNTPATRSPHSRCEGSGGWFRSRCGAGESDALTVAESTSIFTLAESLGAVESLIEHPHRMTHASVAGSALAVDPALLRLSVGLENADDLVSDLLFALAGVDSV